VDPRVSRVNRTRLLYGGAIVLLVLAVFVVIAIIEGDIPDLDLSLAASVVQGKGPLGAVGLLYLEESGVPMPVPGDFFVMYVGRATGGQAVPFVAAWLGLIAAVVLGASNLYLLSRRFGRRLVDGRVGEILHITPERMVRAERAFKRWGVLAIIFGRHIPGLRVPITVVAGTLRTPYPVFAASVAVSSAVWAGIFLIVGVKVGTRVSGFLSAHHSTYFVIGGLIAIAIAYVAFRVVKVIWFTPAGHARDHTASPASPDLPASPPAPDA
jgi:membrane-associated protein